MFLLIPVLYVLHKGAMTHFKEQKAFRLFSRECLKLTSMLEKKWTSLALRTGSGLLTSVSRLWSKDRCRIALLYANPRRSLNFGDKVLSESLGRQHHTIIMQKLCLPFPRLVLHGQMMKTVKICTKICTFTHKKRVRKVIYNRQGLG